jgi:hypothetical protein
MHNKLWQYFMLGYVCCFALFSTDVLSQARRDSSTVKREKAKTGTAPQTKPRAKKPMPKDFVPMPDRWRDVETPPYERNVKGRWYDPYNQNLLKGDYPIPRTKHFFG